VLSKSVKQADSITS